MSQYKTYSEYRDPGVGWLNTIPSHWLCVKAKHILHEKKKKTGVNLPCGSISFGVVKYKDSERIPEETRQAYQEVLAGEFLINPLNMNYDLKSLRTALSEKDVIVSSGYIVLKHNSEYSPGFVRWLLYAFDILEMKSLGTGIRQTINFNDIGNSYFSIPPVPEQTAIATFLDRETSRIDRLIDAKKRFIERLKEKRQALISHAVTKGLDPNAPMKDSGVEWIGEIPEGWETTKIKHISKCLDGKRVPLNSEERGKIQGDYPYHGATKIMDYINDWIFDETLVLLGEDGAPFFDPLKDVSRVSQGKVWVNNHCHVLRVSEESCDPRYISHCLNSLDYRPYIFGSTRDKLNQEAMKDIDVPIPDLLEQRDISDNLDCLLHKISLLIDNTLGSISLLNEKRTALITAAVTGKIDVRDEA